MKILCPECGEAFDRKHGNQDFCSPAHRQAFHHRNAARGQVIIPFLQVMRRGKKRGDDPNASYAFAELCALADVWNAQDRAAGRRPDLAVASKKAACWSAADWARNAA